MSIAALCLAEAAVSAQGAQKPMKTPGKRQVVAKTDASVIPEPR
jgi:hypothetical protein